MTIFCNNCNHASVSWLTNHGLEIPSRSADPHFRRESFDNFHRLWIEKVTHDDDGIYTVQKETDEKQCELHVIGKIRNINVKILPPFSRKNLFYLPF